LTDQQRRAVVTRGASVVLSSGAGCGKTHVLTERYLSHLRDDGAEVGQIVAITFTDRAAREMRGRIRRAIVQHLRDVRGDDAAEQTWGRHLRALETAPISTIHSFCAALLRQHAVEAGLDPCFDVLEEVLSVNIEAESLNASLQRLLTATTDVGEDLRQLVLLFGWRVVVEAVGHLLHARDERAWQTWLDQPPEQVAADWQGYARASLLPRYVAYLMGARPAIARCLELLCRHPPRPGEMAAKVDSLFAGLPRLAEAPDLGAAVADLIEAAKVGRIGAKAWPDAAVYGEIKEAFEKFRADLKSRELEGFAVKPEELEETVRAGGRFLRVAGEAAAVYRARKRGHGVVDFQDLLLLSRDLLRDHAEVRARLQERYRFLLLDELQDTDPVQMELIGYLCGAGLTAGKLFAVGDANQSIYLFRGADVHLFRELRDKVPHEGRQGLTVNFRSQPAVLDFTNALLGHRLADYEPLVAHHPQVNPGPCVEFLWTARPEKASAAHARALEAESIARRIADMVRNEALVVNRDGDPSRLRAVRPGDVVLLFRAMSNVHLYEAALRRHGLNYYLVGGRAFFAQQEIYDLLNLLRALENPQDAVSLAGTLRSPFCCLSDEALFVLGGHPDGLWAGLLDEDREARLPAGQHERVRRARRHLQRWRGLKDRLPIARLLGAVFADSGFDAATQFEFLGERKLANLWKLLDLARAFDRTGLFGLAEFIDRLGDFVRRQPREEQAATQPENADVVRLMTIHQAKGLEFSVVILPDLAAVTGGAARPVAEWDANLGCVVRPPADEETPPFPEFGWKLRQTRAELEEWHEDLRILYVACTRARDFLVLSASLAEPFQATNAWMITLAERFDMVTGRCLVGDVPEGRVPQVRVYRSPGEVRGAG
jgi:ATP-dependent helicase/nuclease subunit A